MVAAVRHGQDGAAATRCEAEVGDLAGQLVVRWLHCRGGLVSMCGLAGGVAVDAATRLRRTVGTPIPLLKDARDVRATMVAVAASYGRLCWVHLG